MILYYTVELHSFWHAGSGLGTRTDFDSVVIKDENDIAYLPGKTVAGLVKDAAKDIVKYGRGKYPDLTETLFGRDNPESADPKVINTEPESTADGKCCFSNAYPLAYAAIEKHPSYFYSARMATALDENHQAENHSLRKIQVTLPCILAGSIAIEDKNALPDSEAFIKACLGLIKRLSHNRTRGLGRCEFTLHEKRK